MDYDFNDFRSYHFDQIRALVNWMADAEGAGVVATDNHDTLFFLLRDKINEAGDYLDQIVWKN